MGVTCQILINKPRKGGHKAGTPVTGIVKYAFDEPTECENIALSFTGKGICSWDVYVGVAIKTCYGSEDYVSRHVDITNKTFKKAITLHGAYEYPFEFSLPENIPSSHKDKIGKITYDLKLKFVKSSFFSSNKVFSTEIPVYGSVDLTTLEGTTKNDGPVIFGLEKSFFAPFAEKKINLKAEIAKTCLTPGENVHLSYTLTNNTDVAITAVRADLYCYTTYTANCGGTKTKHDRVKRCKVKTPGVPERQVGNHTCVLPTLPELYSIQNSKIISKEYRVLVTVQLPMPYENITAEVPIVIGQRKSSETYREACDDADPQPPSYLEVMTVNEDQVEEKTAKA